MTKNCHQSIFLSSGFVQDTEKVIRTRAIIAQYATRKPPKRHQKATDYIHKNK